MEITTKRILSVAIPALIAAIASIADNAFKWRTEMEQKQYDRQTKILDNMLMVQSSRHRLMMGEFYLAAGFFTGDFKKELEISINIQRELVKQEEMLTSLAGRPSNVKKKVHDYELPNEIDSDDSVIVSGVVNRKLNPIERYFATDELPVEVMSSPAPPPPVSTVFTYDLNNNQ